jgi:hypothetical protein
MSDTNKAEWSKELRILLDRIQSNPSQDLLPERERVVVLNTLLATHAKEAAAA